MSGCTDRKAVGDIIFLKNRVKIVRLLLNEITLLDICFYKTESMKEQDIIKFSLEIFENLLKIHGFVSDDLSNMDYEDITKFIYTTIENTFKKLNNEGLDQ